MALSSAQIITLATQIAKVRGFTAQAGMLLNTILAELCQDYDFDVCKGTFLFDFSQIQQVQLGAFNDTFNATFTHNSQIISSQCGPYFLPSDWLRVGMKDFFYTIDGVPYFPINVSNAEFDAFVTTAGLNSFPQFYTIFSTPLLPANAPVGTKPSPVMFIWPPASGAYPATVRYYRQMPDIDTPETSNVVPWFPNTQYLITRLAGELCRLSGDMRADGMLGDGDGTLGQPVGAGHLLGKFLKMTNDMGDRVNTVQLDRRLFTPSFAKLPNTKKIGW